MRATLRYATRSFGLRYAGDRRAGLSPSLSSTSTSTRATSFLPFSFSTVVTCGEEITLCSDEACDDMKGGGRGGGGPNMRAGKRPVSEANRITMAERLEQFRAGPDQKMTFESGLSNHERAVIHEVCKKMGLKSKSYGKGQSRRLTVFKHGNESRKDKSVASSLVFSAEAHAAIQQLFVSYPPTENEASWKLNDTASEGGVGKSQKSKQRAFKNAQKSLMNESDIKKQVALLAARLQSMPALQQISQERAKLPITKFKDEIATTIEKNQVVLIAGQTGCGKTTQVPQFILGHLWSEGRPCRILCTQPRRISASSVAERIAAERGEPVGQTVGYQIKLESKGGIHSSLMFCTNGVLLRKLVSAGAADVMTNLNATHIIVDEIHERDRDADFMLIALRDLLSVQPDLRLILMSATLDAELFSRYFNNCPVIRVPGFTYPVQSFYLDDVIVATKAGEDSMLSSGISLEIGTSSPLGEEDAATMDEAIGLAWLEDDFDLFIEILSRDLSPSVCNYQHSLTGTTPLMVAAGKGRLTEVLLLLSRGANMDLTSQDGTTALDWAERYGREEIKEILVKHKNTRGDPTLAAKRTEMLEQYLSSIDQDEIDTNLIERLLRKICTTVTAGISPDHLGSILIFLPGWEDITRTRECLEASTLFGDPKKFLLLPLHSMIPSEDQKKVFKSPSPGVRKIILATNIAETAITINDIVFVIDSGRVKEKSYDPYSNVSTLQTAWISKASARQREGRAGRCQPGVCYHLYSRVRANALPDYQVPEIKRTSLEELCLQVKLLDSNSNIKEFLGKSVEPPNELSISNAIRLLQDIGALSSDERLTELGEQLGALPVHPSTSKMLLLGILLNCLGPALTIACAAGSRDPFILPLSPEGRKRAFAVKRELASAYGGYSDDLAIVEAFNRWEAAQAKKSERRFCEQNFLSIGTMAMLAGMRQQLQKELAQKGFIPNEPCACSLNAYDPGIVRALLVAGSYPMVGTLLPAHPTGRKPVVQTAQGMKVKIHPHSLNFNLVHEDTQKSNPILVFDEVTRGEAWMYIRNCTVVNPHPLLLSAIEMVVAPPDTEGRDSDEDDESSDCSDAEDAMMEDQEEQLMSDPNSHVVVVVDRWLKFQATAVEAAQLYCLRERLAAAIAFKLKNPRKVLPPLLGNSVFAVACLLSYDGQINIKERDRPQAASFEGTRNLSILYQEGTGHVKSQNRKSGNFIGSSSGRGMPSSKFKQTQSGLKKPGNVASHYIKRQRGNSFC
eukprot:c11023_g1_i1 orf=66-3809(+)